MLKIIIMPIKINQKISNSTINNSLESSPIGTILMPLSESYFWSNNKSIKIKCLSSTINKINNIDPLVNNLLNKEIFFKSKTNKWQIICNNSSNVISYDKKHKNKCKCSNMPSQVHSKTISMIKWPCCQKNKEIAKENLPIT